MTPLLRTGAGIWNDFAALIGVSPRHAEAALYSERAARASLAAHAPGQALSRRSLFGASAALAAGVAFGFPAARAESRKMLLLGGEWYEVFEIPMKGCSVYYDTDGNIITYEAYSKYPEGWPAPARSKMVLNGFPTFKRKTRDAS